MDFLNNMREDIIDISASIISNMVYNFDFFGKANYLIKQQFLQLALIPQM
jgi:hypothetical protein